MEGQRRPIRCYVSPAGRNKVEQWLDELAPQRQMDARSFMDVMAKVADWTMPDYRSLKGYANLGELRWTSEKTEHRLIGFFQHGGWIAVMGCTKKGKVYSPADALDTADKRRRQILNREAGIEPYEFSD